MMSLTDEQILTDHDLRKYYLLRARCEVCRTKTWHYYFFETFDFQPIGELKPVTHITETSRCIEHSNADHIDLFHAGYPIKAECLTEL